MIVRPMTRSDLEAVGAIAESIGMFPAVMLGDMTAPYLSGGSDEGWIVAEGETGVEGAAHFAPERMTDRAWNLLFIAVRSDRHGAGVGRELMAEAEHALRARDARLVLVDTSGSSGFSRTRAFYARLGNDFEARVRDYYQAGEDKITFRKLLGPG